MSGLTFRPALDGRVPERLSAIVCECIGAALLDKSRGVYDHVLRGAGIVKTEIRLGVRIPSLVIALLALMTAGCEPALITGFEQEAVPGVVIHLPDSEGSWVPDTTEVGRVPEGRGAVEIEDVGRFEFEATEVETVRPDIFQRGHFSMFDALVLLDNRGDIDLQYHYDAAMATHIIDSVNGTPHWWYTAHYSAGWFETNAFRMDMCPYKDETRLRVYRTTEEYFARICRSFGDEMRRLSRNQGQVVIPEVTIEDPTGNRVLKDVVVTAHDVRTDVLQPGTVTALDVLLSLGEHGEFSRLRLNWYASIAQADPVDSYWVERIDEAVAFERCGYVYEVGSQDFAGFAGSHVHIPIDVRVLVSPEYALWFWLCL